MSKEGKTKEGHQLFFEVSNEDERFSDNENVKLVDATLGEVGQVLDSVVNPSIKRVLLSKIRANFLGCQPDDIVETTKSYAPYRSPLIRYALTKIEGFKFEKLAIDDDGATRYIEGGDKDLQVIPIGPEKSAKVPKYFNYGVTDKAGRKFCFMTDSDWGAFFLRFYYDGNSNDGEKAVDDFIESLDKTIEKHNYLKGGRITPAGEFLKLSDKKWEDIELPDIIKRQIQSNIINLIRKEEIYEKNGISSKRGLLFVGKPGTGKTLVCKVLASELKEFTFIWVTANDLRESSDVEHVYTMARELSPSIVLLEDADLFCTDRNMGSRQPILGEILSQLDGLVELKKVVTIMTSNQPGAMDKALTERPGRFDIQIEFAPPERDSRRRLLQKALGKVNVSSKEIESILDESDGLTGAQLVEVANLATIYAIEDDSLNSEDIAIVKAEHLLKALQGHLSPRIRREDIKTTQTISPESSTENKVPCGLHPPIRGSYLEHFKVDPTKDQIMSESANNKPVKKANNILNAIDRILPNG